MYAIQYLLTNGKWVILGSWAIHKDRVSAERYMKENCSSVIYKRIVPYLPHYRTRKEIR